MASRNIPPFDMRKSSNKASRLSVVVFVAFSLFAIWIFLPSSPAFLVENPDLLYQENDSLGHRVTNGSSGDTQIQSQDVSNDGKRTVEKGSEDAGEQTKFDSANAVETDLEGEISEESTPGKTSSEKTSDRSDMSEFDNETEDRQKNNYYESNESREEQNMGMSNTEGGQKDGEQTMDDAASDLDEKFNRSKGNDFDMVDRDEKLNAEGSLDDIKQDNKEVNQNAKRVQQDQDKNSKKPAANNNLEIQEQNVKLSQQDSKEQNYCTWKVCKTTAGPKLSS